jgi:hypothetical protein
MGSSGAVERIKGALKASAAITLAAQAAAPKVNVNMASGVLEHRPRIVLYLRWTKSKNHCRDLYCPRIQEVVWYRRTTLSLFPWQDVQGLMMACSAHSPGLFAPPPLLTALRGLAQRAGGLMEERGLRGQRTLWLASTAAEARVRAAGVEVGGGGPREAAVIKVRRSFSRAG